MNKRRIIEEFVNKQDNETFVLDYPYKVIYKKVSEPVSFVAFFTKIGSIYEKEDYKGIAHLIEHCVFRGSKNYPQD
ncbi:MAG: insulinase family protein, partial [bacterium]